MIYGFWIPVCESKHFVQLQQQQQYEYFPMCSSPANNQYLIFIQQCKSVRYSKPEEIQEMLNKVDRMVQMLKTDLTSIKPPSCIIIDTIPSDLVQTKYHFQLPVLTQ
jgi:hypothetical protein